MPRAIYMHVIKAWSNHSKGHMSSKKVMARCMQVCYLRVMLWIGDILVCIVFLNN